MPGGVPDPASAKRSRRVPASGSAAIRSKGFSDHVVPPAEGSIVRPGGPAIAALVLGISSASGVARAGDGAIEMHGQGVQIYRCAPSGGGFAWHLVGPEAVLSDAAGARIGNHFAGPTWQANDGSRVVGEAVASSASPDAGAVPWLVLHAKSHAGAGAFASTTFIVRMHTVGGAAPGQGCDRVQAGHESRIPYSATYLMFRQPGPAP